jgi:hypothetical protein
MSITVLCAYYGLVACIAIANLLTDPNRMKWYEIVGITVAWPILIPVAATGRLIDNIKTHRKNKEQDKYQKMYMLMRVLRKMDLISWVVFSETISKMQRKQ